MLRHRSNCLAGLSDAEVLTVVVFAVIYFGNCYVRVADVLTGGYFPHKLSPSRFNRRLHALADWFEPLIETLGAIVAQAQAVIYDYLLDSRPVCCRAVPVVRFIGERTAVCSLAVQAHAAGQGCARKSVDLWLTATATSIYDGI